MEEYGVYEEARYLEQDSSNRGIALAIVIATCRLVMEGNMRWADTDDSVRGE